MKKPFVPINHLEGHILSPTFNNEIKYPFVSFLLTGGHTQIYLINSVNNYELLGETLDDAVGEAFDKVAKLIKLSYPGGPEIEKIAKSGNLKTFNLPHPLKNKEELNFSFSGIKTAVNLIVKKEDNLTDVFKSNIAACFQNTVTEILSSKLYILLQKLKNKNIKISQVSIVGGVAQNKYIFKKMQLTSKAFNCVLIIPPKYMFSDNAAMIAWACISKYKINKFSNIYFKENPRLSIVDSVS